MNRTWLGKALAAGALAVAIGAGPAWAAGFFTNGVPPAGGTQYPTTIPLTGIETVPADTGLAAGVNPQSEAISTLQLAGYAAGMPARRNILIGGDAGTNLFQRATTGSSVTTTLAYGGPDRWAYWSGTNTAMTVSRDTTAGDLQAGFQAAFKMARTSGQTGVVQVCMAQEVETVNAVQLQGQTAELSFYATTGANFSAASSNMTAYIVTGTGSDQGLAGTASMAFTLNAGGGGSGGWTGQANATAAVISLGGVSTSGRYVAIAAIPAGATEVGVALCFTPVGTASTNDYVAFSGIQLVRNPALAGLASATVGYSCASVQCSGYDKRQVGEETLLQQRYYYRLTETAAITPVAPCAAVDTTHTNCLVQFPAPMRSAPSLAFANGFASPTSTTQATLGACTTLSAATTVTSTVANVLNALVNCAASTIPAAGIASFLYSNNGTGTISASAEL